MLFRSILNCQTSSSSSSRRGCCLQDSVLRDPCNCLLLALSPALALRSLFIVRSLVPHLGCLNAPPSSLRLHYFPSSFGATPLAHRGHSTCEHASRTSCKIGPVSACSVPLFCPLPRLVRFTACQSASKPAPAFGLPATSLASAALHSHRYKA